MVVVDNRENENLDDLIGDSRYIPFLHRTRESNTSLTVKWIVNFLASVVQMVNIPFFFFLLLIAVEQVGQQLNSSFTIPYKIFLLLVF